MNGAVCAIVKKEEGDDERCRFMEAVIDHKPDDLIRLINDLHEVRMEYPEQNTTSSDSE